MSKGFISEIPAQQRHPRFSGMVVISLGEDRQLGRPAATALSFEFLVDTVFRIHLPKADRQVSAQLPIILSFCGGR
jgi:hypothetical protein